MRTLLIIAMLAIASAAFAEIPWADSIIHTNPVLERGLGPEMVSSGYQIIALTNTGRDGEKVDSYTSWMSGHSDETVWVKFRPGEAVEAKCTGTRQIVQNDRRYCVETWEAKRIMRCGNPTAITFYVWREATETKTVTVEKVVEKTTAVDVNIKPQPVQVDVKIEPVQVEVKPIDLKVDIKLNQTASAPPAPQPIIINNWNLMPSVYPSAQMMGMYAPSIYQYQLLGVSTTSPTRISVSATGGAGGAGGTVGDIDLSQSQTSVDVNNNVINVGPGSATGTATATGDSTAGNP